MTTTYSRSLLLAATAAIALLAGPAGAQSNTVEVLHWWTAGGTAAAVGKFKEAAKASGVDWKDVAIAGDGNQRTLLRARVMKGDAPAAAQISMDLNEYAEDPARLYSIDAIARDGNWDAVLPGAVRDFVKLSGPSYVAVPLNIHRQSVMFVSDAALKKIGASAPPASWDEFFAQADKAKAAGLVPFAWGTTRFWASCSSRSPSPSWGRISSRAPSSATRKPLSGARNSSGRSRPIAASPPMPTRAR